MWACPCGEREVEIDGMDRRNVDGEESMNSRGDKASEKEVILDPAEAPNVLAMFS